ncbi:MAG: ribulose-phosphate 3-epimerase [Candidatus Thermoplasmatota archaeon]|nr:ribulose-phosphate 3-epimerase [Candidatus Thermoplasmatota archaeon]
MRSGKDKIKIAPSILSADFSCLEDSIKAVKSTEWLHLDVMDGHFVPNITFGPCVIKSIREKSDHVFDTHLMISEPEKYAEEFAEAGSDIITFHAEAVDDPKSVIEEIENCGVQVGVSLKPDTPFDAVREYLPSLDLILIMTVEPGFSGQSFMQEVVPKIKEAREAVDEIEKDIDISVDGGISPKTAPQVVENGSNVLVSGSSVFKGDVDKNLKELRDSVK